MEQAPENPIHTLLEEVEKVIVWSGLDTFDADEEELAPIREALELPESTTIIVVEHWKPATATEIETISSKVATLSSPLYDVTYSGEAEMEVGYIIITPHIN